MTELAVRGAFITLGQLLKAAGIAATGGEAKTLLEEGGIVVNGQVLDGAKAIGVS